MSSIAIAGSIAQRRGHAGHAWVFLQYLLGLRSLGYEPIFIDQLTPEMCIDASGRYSPELRKRSIDWLAEVMQSCGLGTSYCLLLEDGSSLGLCRAEVLKQLARSPALVNVMGFLDDPEVLAASQRRIFLDIDPGFGQMWRELGLADVFSGHDQFVTIAENIGEADCTVPTCGLSWITTKPPVELSLWPPAEGGSAITTVASWRGPFASLRYNGRTYGLRAHEFRRFTDLPQLVGEPFELALDIEDSDQRDIELLGRSGWRLVEPARAAGTIDRYRRYIQKSKAELMVAKQMYVRTRCGWFSDRSACYLASGKPVLAQDTGFTRHYPVGEGLLSFRNPEEASEGAREVSANWKRHARTARQIAEDVFDARKVLRRLLDNLGLP